MKQIILAISGLLCRVACNQKIDTPEPDGPRKIHLNLKANAPELAGTRTEIKEYDNEIHTWWSADDAITVIPLMGPSWSWDGDFHHDKFYSWLSTSSPSAVFSGMTGWVDRPYVAVAESLWDQESNYGKYWNTWENNGEPILEFCVPYYQNPKATSFDHWSDLLISDRFFLEENKSSDEYELKFDLVFHRKVAIVRIQLIDDTENGLFSQEKIEKFDFINVGNRLWGFYEFPLLAADETLFIYDNDGDNDGGDTINAYYYEDDGNGDEAFKIGEEGKAVWLCTLPTTLKEGSTLQINGYFQNKVPGFYRIINLKQDIPLPEGEVTTLTFHLKSENQMSENN